MSDINLDFTVSNNNINFTVEPNDITFTPSEVQLSIYAGGIGSPGGSVGQLQYNAGDVLNGVPATSWDGSILTLGNVANVAIGGGSNGYVLQTDGAGNLTWASVGNSNYASFSNIANTANALNAISTSNVIIGGGTNGYVLQTDGAGNLTWTAQTGGGGGNGVPGGANTQVQFNDAGVFGGDAGFTYNKNTNILTVDQANIATAFISGNANITTVNGNLVGDITVVSNADLGDVGNVIITGGSSGQVLSTDGAGNLAWSSTATPGGWTTVANISVGDILMGKAYNTTVINPGNTITTTTVTSANNWATYNSGVANGLFAFTFEGNKFWSTVGSANAIASSVDGRTWITANVPLTPSFPPVKGSTNFVIFDSGTNVAAYSSDGNTWSTTSLPGGTQAWKSIGYGNNTFIITSYAPGIAPLLQRSTNDGVTWSNVTAGLGNSALAFSDIGFGNNKFIMTIFGSSIAKRSTDLGATWSNVTMSSTSKWNSIAYGNGKWVAVSEYTPGTIASKAAVSTNDGNTWSEVTLANTSWAGLTYANGVFIASDNYSGNVVFSTDGTTWNYANSGLGINGGGSTAFDPNTQTLLNGSGYGPNSSIALSVTPRIVVSPSDGNVLQGTVAPSATYKNLGGAEGNVGALWIRTA